MSEDEKPPGAREHSSEQTPPPAPTPVVKKKSRRKTSKETPSLLSPTQLERWNTLRQAHGLPPQTLAEILEGRPSMSALERLAERLEVPGDPQTPSPGIPDQSPNPPTPPQTNGNGGQGK